MSRQSLRLKTTSRVSHLSAAHVAGWIILHPIEGDTANLAALAASGVPVVTVATAPERIACASVIVDNHGATRAVVQHLIAHGHRHIAYVDQGPDHWSRERYEGYREALQAHGIAHDPSLVIDTTQIRIEFDPAQSIVGLGIDLEHLTIESTLASAIRMLQIRRLSWCRAHAVGLPTQIFRIDQRCDV